MSDETTDPVGTYAESAGDPGPAADLPPTTGRDPETGTPDTPFATGGVIGGDALTTIGELGPEQYISLRGNEQDGATA